MRLQKRTHSVIKSYNNNYQQTCKLLISNSVLNWHLNGANDPKHNIACPLQAYNHITALCLKIISR